jgi:chorismate mutase
MSKKRIIVMAAAGLLSFAGAFVLGWLTTGADKEQAPDALEPTVGSEEARYEVPRPQASAVDSHGPGVREMRQGMAEKQLKNLVYEVREKIEEYESRLQGLGVREQRLRLAHDMIKKDIEQLNNLRTELALTVAELKNERDKLIKSRVEITKAERENIVAIAAAYDKMDAPSAGKILASMCSDFKVGQEDPQPAESGVNDAVKILNFMTERTKAKLLAELVNSEPKLAAFLCQRLKQVVAEE